MKFYIITILLFLISSPYDKQDSFEGTIKFKVTVDLKVPDNEFNEYLSKKWGDTLIVHYKSDGSQKRIYQNSQPKGYDFNLYDAKTNQYYCKWHNLDTLYYRLLKKLWRNSR